MFEARYGGRVIAGLNVTRRLEAFLDEVEADLQRDGLSVPETLIVVHTALCCELARRIGTIAVDSMSATEGLVHSVSKITEALAEVTRARGFSHAIKMHAGVIAGRD